MITTEIKQMPVKDRMILMEEIWDTLRHEEEEIRSPHWHEEVLEERMKKLDSGRAKLISLEELKNGRK